MPRLDAPSALARTALRAARTVLAVGLSAAGAGLLMLATAGPAEAQTTGTDGDPMEFTFVADADGDDAALLFGSSEFDSDGEETVRVRIDWGDGTATEDRTSVGFVGHEYATAGTYTVKVWPLYADEGGSDTGPWLTIYGANRGGGSTYWLPLGDTPADEGAVARMTAVVSFGDLGITSLRNAFNRHRHLTDVPSSLPSTVTDLGYAFRYAEDFNGAGIGSWDVSSVTTMENMFEDATAFDQDLSDWDVSSVSTMENMFEGASSFDQPLEPWKARVSNVTDFSDFLKEASAFDRPLTGWDVSGADDLDSFLEDATSFDSSIADWTFSSTVGIDLSNFFEGASAFDQPLSSWDVSSVDDTNDMFKGATLFDQDLSGWDVSNVTDMNDMFEDASAFDRDLSGWDVSNVTDMNAMFNGASTFDEDLGDWQLNASVDLVRMLDGSGLSVANYDATLLGWAALDPAVNGRSLGAAGLQYSADGLPGRCILVNDRSWTISGDSDGGVDVGDCAAPVAAPRSIGPTLACSPSSPAVGTEVTCDVTGGDPSIDVLWQATAEGTPIASTGVTLGPDGTGTFRFVAPASALGLPLEVELVGWDRTDDVGVVGGPVPATVPAGDGPSPGVPGRGPIALGILALLAVALRARRQGGEMSPSRA